MQIICPRPAAIAEKAFRSCPPGKKWWGADGAGTGGRTGVPHAPGADGPLFDSIIAVGPHGRGALPAGLMRVVDGQPVLIDRARQGEGLLQRLDAGGVRR